MPRLSERNAAAGAELDAPPVAQSAPALPPERARRNVWLLGGASLSNDVASEMALPVVPLLLATVLGAPLALVGAIEGFAEAVSSLGRLPAGWWADRAAKRRPFVMSGYAISLAARPLFALAQSWPVVALARAADRAGKAVRNPARDALLAESAAEGARGRAFGLHRALDTVGAVIGTSIAFLVLVRLESGGAEGALRAVLWIATVPAALALVFLLFVKEPAARVAAAKVPPGFLASARALPRELRRYLLATGLFALANVGIAFFLLRVTSLGLPPSRALLALLAMNVVYAAASYPLGALADRWGARRVVLLGFVAYAIIVAGFALVASLAAALALFVLLGLYFAASEGQQRALVVALAPPHLKGTALGAHAFVAGVAAIPASLLAGVAWDVAGPAWTFGVASALAALAAVALGVLDRRARVG